MAAQRASAENGPLPKSNSPRTPITTADFGRAVLHRYTAALDADEENRDRYPSKAEVATELENLTKRAEAGEIASGALAALDAMLDVLHLRKARSLDQFTREARLKALKDELVAGETHQVEHEIDEYLARHGLAAEQGSAERAVLVEQLMRSEIKARQRKNEGDRGDYGGKPTDPVVKPTASKELTERVSISQLWSDYLKIRVQAGFIKDGGKRQEAVI